MNITTNKYYLYAVILLCFFFDLIAFNLFEKQLVCTLLCLFSIYITRHTHFVSVFLMMALLSLESFLYYSRFGLQLIYLIPLYGIGSVTQKIFYKNRVYPFLVLISLLLIQTLLENYFLSLSTSFGYTVSRIFVNITILWIISLIYR